MSEDRSCQNIVNQTTLTQALSGITPCSCNTGSYCKTILRLPLSLISELMSRGVEAVFEQYGARKRKVDFLKGTNLGKYDHLITYSKPRVRPAWFSQAQYDAVPNTLIIRELKVGNTILVTIILSPKDATKEELKK
jgi:hypothetical protein